ncbi:fluoride efflux transporter CrcB [Sphingomonas colocasiae]|uniref:Fluoride-specific ion channel FluC n=1 Tax=Sphingomonas colocasiae TaxID=1848973 RepID=A0ABS7PUD0_9SPHN|nr:fluoride efflux transporter CrcB [Sphingomonas colocasiae]MBY8824878.1 fluoride efflux transporter CrcB [Sphingomonas colocasiae]
MIHLFLVMLGGALGSGARYGVGRASLAMLGPGYPWGTLTVNLAGGFAMGLLAGLISRFVSGEEWRLLLGVGVLGGFTTFSAFSLEVANMIERGTIGTAALYVAVSVVGSVAALFVGLALARGFA